MKSRSNGAERLSESVPPSGGVISRIEVSSDISATNCYGVRALNDVEKSWLGAVIDGEGSVFITKLTTQSRRKIRRDFAYVPAINLSSSSRTFAEKVKEVIGKGAVNFVKEERLDWKDRWVYRGYSNVLRGLLPQLMPSLSIKRDVAEKVLEFVTFIEVNPVDGAKEIPPGYYEKLDALYAMIKKLNKKGDDSKSIESLMTRPNSLARGGREHRVSNCRELKEKERAWVAGVVDGEGSLLISKVIHPAYRRGFFYRPQFLVSNSNRAFLVRVQEIIGEGTVQLARKGVPGTKTRWEYLAVAGVLRHTLPRILPYLIVKREQAEIMLRFFAYIDANPIRGKRVVYPEYYIELDRLYGRMKELNEKGKRNTTITIHKSQVSG